MQTVELLPTTYEKLMEKRKAVREFFEAVGGPQGYLLLKTSDPRLAAEIAAAFGVDEPADKKT